MMAEIADKMPGVIELLLLGAALAVIAAILAAWRWRRTRGPAPRSVSPPAEDPCRLYPRGTPQDGTYDLGIVVPAVAIEDRIVRRFLDALAEHADTRSSYIVCVVTDAPGAGTAKLNLSTARNAGLRRLLASCRTVACADVDGLVPPGLVDWTAREANDRNVWVPPRPISEAEVEPHRWHEWLSRPTHDICWGSWNAMSPANWRRVGGWDERCFGWGGEDAILHERIRAAGIAMVTCREFPLMHVAHPPRAFGRPHHRRKANSRFFARPQPNFLAGA